MYRLATCLILFLFFAVCTVAPAQAESPTPTVDARLVPVLQAIRDTGPVGEWWANKIVVLRTNVLIDSAHECDAGAAACFDAGDGNTIYVVESWYNKHHDSPLHLGLVVVHEMAHLVWSDALVGTSRNAEECYQDEANAENQSARWIIEHVGPVRAKQFKSVQAYLTETQLARVKEVGLWQEQCGALGTGTPQPTPAPVPATTTCNADILENRIWWAMKRASNAPDGIVDYVLETRVRPRVPYAMTLEGLYAAKGRAYPERKGQAVTQAMDFCEWIARSIAYGNEATLEIWPFLSHAEQQRLNRAAGTRR